MFQNISIIGDGGMGTVLGMLLCEKGLRARIWGYDGRQLEEMAKNRENKKFLPGHKLPRDLEFEHDDRKAISGADLIVSAVPCQYMRQVWNRLKQHVPEGVPIVSVAKGIENDTLLRPTQIIAEILDSQFGVQRSATHKAARSTQHDERSPRDSLWRTNMRLAVLSGPTIADELARKLPATACSASRDESLAKEIQHTFSDKIDWFRVYTNTDVVGVELAGAMKNVIAIAAGIIDGAGAGDNAKAALLTRGLAEIKRLGVKMGARPQTFSGLTGLGDLVTTCISPTGRNRSFGERIGRGQTLEQARSATESVIEGIATCKSVTALARQYGVEMPITQAVYEVLFENKPVHKAIVDLMKRRLKAE
jgi:glycerol-3-phosphate dehydrogenase (NAD(P)+)